MTEDKPILYSEELEEQVLSNLLNYSELIGQYGEVLSEEMFHNPKHKALYRAIRSVYDEGETPDLPTVGMYLMRNPDSLAPEAWELAKISSTAASSVNFPQNTDTLLDLAKRRKYWALGHRLISAGTDITTEISEIDKEIDTVREENLSASKDVYDMRAVNEALSLRIQQNCNDERANMIPTGFELIDEKGGFQLTDLNVIAGATSQGKSTLAVNMLVNAARKGVAGMMFTLEMTIEQLAARINAPLSGVNSSLMLYKKLRTDQLRDFEKAKAVSNSLPIYIDDSSTNYEKIKDSIRANAKKRKVKVFFIDYIQILSSTRKRQDGDAQFLETICRELKNLAKELRVCIVVLSQLNRDAKESDPRPTLSKIKASSGIEQAADTVIMIYRPGYYGKKHKYRPDLDADKTSEIIIGKGRNIGTGSGYVGFKPELSQFYDLLPDVEGEKDKPAKEPQEETKLPF